MDEARAGQRLKIEMAVRERRVHAALALIGAWARGGRQPAYQIEASEWLRRLGRYREALKVLEIEGWVENPHAVDREILFQAAYILNGMGANDFARKILANVQASSTRQWRLCGQIHLDQLNWAEARRAFRKWTQQEKDLGSYASRLVRLAEADACSGLGFYDEAISISEKLIQESPEALLQGICRQARGEYLARAGRFRPAEKALNEALPYFPPQDRSPDSAFLWKWQAYVAAKLGHKSQALKLFRRAEAILWQPSLRPEAGLDVLRLKQEVGLLSPALWKRLLHYPGLLPEFQALQGKRGLENSSAFFGASEKSARLFINLPSQEFRVGRHLYWGIPAELKALAALVIAGEWGLSSVRLQTVLWPDEPFSYLQLQKRLESVLHRLRRTYKIRLSAQAGLLKVLPLSLREVGVSAGPATRPSLLAKSALLYRKDVEAHYRVSSTQAGEYLQKWTERGWIAKKLKGPQTHYKLI